MPSTRDRSSKWANVHSSVFTCKVTCHPSWGSEIHCLGVRTVSRAASGSRQHGSLWASSSDGSSLLPGPQEWWYSNSTLTEDQWRRTVQNLPSWEKIVANKVNMQDIQKNKFLMRVNILDNPF